MQHTVDRDEQGRSSLCHIVPPTYVRTVPTMTNTYCYDRTTRTRSDLAALRTTPLPFQHRYLQHTRVLNHAIPPMGAIFLCMCMFMQPRTALALFIHMIDALVGLPSDHSNNQAYEAQLYRHLDCRERCRQFDIATVICEASADMHHLGEVDDDDSLSDDPGYEPGGRTSHPVTTMVGLLQSLRTVAPVSRTIWRCRDYFELASALQCGFLQRCGYKRTSPH